MLSRAYLSLTPVQSSYEIFESHAEAARQPQQRLEGRLSDATFQSADERRAYARRDAEIQLTQPRPAAELLQPLAEPPCQLPVPFRPFGFCHAYTLV